MGIEVEVAVGGLMLGTVLDRQGANKLGDFEGNQSELKHQELRIGSQVDRDLFIRFQLGDGMQDHMQITLGLP